MKNVSLALPISQSVKGEQITKLSPAFLQPPVNQKAMLESWPRALKRLQGLADQDVPELDMLRVWHRKLKDAVYREMMVSVELPSHIINLPALEVAVYAFGDIVHTWYLHGHSSNHTAAKVIRQQVPDACIIGSLPQDLAEKDSLSVFWRSGPVTPSWLYPILDQCRAYRAFFHDPDSQDRPEPLRTVRQLRPGFTAYTQDKHAYNGDELLGAATEFLMVSDSALQIHSAYPGSPFFPAANDQPSLLWNAVKPLFRFAGPEHRKTGVNVVPKHPDVFFKDSYWAAADNRTNSVHVMIRNRISYNGQEVRIDVPVPWAGTTRVVEHALTSSWDQAEGAQSPTGTRVNSVSLLMPEKSSSKGRVTLHLPLTGFQVIELYPENNPPQARKIRVSSVIGFRHVQESESLFHIPHNPLPSWWNRKDGSSTAASMWAYSGKIDLSTPTPATVDRVMDWAPQSQLWVKKNISFEHLTPLKKESTRIRFEDAEKNQAQVVRAGLYGSRLRQADILSFWIRLNSAEAKAPRKSGVLRPVSARLYIGNDKIRQNIKISLNQWYPLISKASYWKGTEGLSGRPALCFWPDPDETVDYELEVHAVSTYCQTGSQGEKQHPASIYVNEEKTGALHILLVGRTGKTANIRQRFPWAVDAEGFTRIVDPGLKNSEQISGQTPVVFRYYSDAQILSLEVSAMPPPPSAAFRAVISEHFPAINRMLKTPATSVALFTFQRDVR